MIDTQYVSLQRIDATRRLRPVDPSWAAIMADDLARGVELPAVLVRPATPDEVAEGCVYQLVAGGHRLEAHRLAGRTEIRADIEEMSRAEACLREVDENLKRNPPNMLDRARFLDARKLAYDEINPETTRGGDRRSADAIKRQRLPFEGAVTFAQEAAALIGLDERTVRDAIKLARSLNPAADEFIRQTNIVDNAAALKDLASAEPEEQVRLVARIARGEARDLDTARVQEGLKPPPPVLDAQEQLFSKVVDLLSRSTARTQKRTLEHLAHKLGFDVTARPVTKRAAR